MIPCPSCGTHNRRGSKFCYHCGQPLDSPFENSCPVCNRLNPTGSIFCAFCGVRLPPPMLDAHDPDNSETRSDRSDAQQEAPERELPAWLYGSQGEHLKSAHSSVQTQAEPSLTGNSKYLQDIEGALPSHGAWLPSTIPDAAESKTEMPTPQTRRGGGCLGLALLAVQPFVSALFARMP